MSVFNKRSKYTKDFVYKRRKLNLNTNKMTGYRPRNPKSKKKLQRGET